MPTAFDTYFNNPAMLLQQLKVLGAEQVTIRQSGSSDRQIWGIVKRMTPEPLPGQVRAGMAGGTPEVTVVNDDSVGLSAKTVATASGSAAITIGIASDVGASADYRTVGVVIKQDAGLVTYRMR